MYIWLSTLPEGGLIALPIIILYDPVRMLLPTPDPIRMLLSAPVSRNFPAWAPIKTQSSKPVISGLAPLPDSYPRATL